MQIIFVIVLMLGLAFSLPVDQRRTNGVVDEPDASPRFRRRVGNLNITSTLEQYVRDLYEEYASENGYGAQDKPTDVWCFADKDVAQEHFRAKPARNAKCETYTQYVFQWSSVASEIENAALSVKNSILRAYIQPIGRHIPNNETVNVTLTTRMVPRNKNTTTNSSDWSNSIFAGQQVISVSHSSDGWAELNVTEGAIEIWPLRKDYTEVQVIITAEVDCINQKKVPFNFVNPAEIPFEKPLRRERHLPIQPFLVINADNEITKTVLQQQQEQDVAGQGDYGSDYINEELYSDTSTHSKRQTIASCSRSNYIVDLVELGLPHIVFPRELNISKCSGTCNNRATISTLGTNHAKIMAHIYNLEQSSPPVTATLPCCVPTKYEVVHMIMAAEDSTATGVQSFNELVATECGCR